MKRRLLTLVLSLTAAFLLNHAVAMASDVNTGEAAEPTDIYTFIDEIEVLSPKTRTVSTAAEEDYRAWTQDDERWGTIELGKSGRTMT